MLGDCVDERGPCELAEGGARGYLLEEAFRGRGADGDVRPCGIQSAQERAGADGGEGAIAERLGHEGEEGRAQEVVGQVVGCQDGGAAEAGPEAAPRAEVRDGGAERGGYGLGFDEEDFLLEEERAFLAVGGGGEWGVGLGGADDGRGGGVFDHGERADQGAVRVADGQAGDEVEHSGEPDECKAPGRDGERPEGLLGVAVAVLLEGVEAAADEVVSKAGHGGWLGGDNVEG